MLYRLARAALFRLEAETAHEIVTGAVACLGELPGALPLLARLYRQPSPHLRRSLWGLELANPVGIAAGFDKNARLVPFLVALGVGFVEVGTVTLEPQAGNPRPRVFRHPASGALLNRLGFNNDGAAVVGRRLRLLRRGGGPGVPLFVNLGKNRDVPLEEAAQNLGAAYRLLAPLAEGVVVNLSSPNTPGLRELQRPEHLDQILDRLLGERAGASFLTAGEHPILVKIAPDLDSGQLSEVAAVCAAKADGIVATNTTIDRSLWSERSGETGGLSGRPLFEPSTRILADLRRLVGPRLPLIGVGGVFGPTEARAKLAAGADLIQLYTGLVYQGPGVVRAIVAALERGDA